jgi:hypothetical protein
MATESIVEIIPIPTDNTEETKETKETKEIKIENKEEDHQKEKKQESKVIVQQCFELTADKILQVQLLILEAFDTTTFYELEPHEVIYYTHDNRSEITSLALIDSQHKTDLSLIEAFKEKEMLFIHSVCTRTGQRKRGLSRKILHEIVRPDGIIYHKTQKHEAIAWLYVEFNNITAIKIYLECGFQFILHDGTTTRELPPSPEIMYELYRILANKMVELNPSLFMRFVIVEEDMCK